jgi:glycolate oxidase iron-sulfur subunit
MQTRFSAARLADPDIAEANGILRACVHCGFCTATCPTYVLLGDELDGPRGRIYLIKEMLEQDRPPSATDMLHIDRCLSCLACMTTCPSGVHYMHLVDHARYHIEKTGRRTLRDRVLRDLLGRILPHPARAARALALARLVRPLARRLPGALGRLAALTPAQQSSKVVTPSSEQVAYQADGERRYRVALLAGCVQQAVAPQINAATIRVLTRHGCEVVVAAGTGCCGALTHHLGQEARARAAAAANIRAWAQMRDSGGLDAVIVNASGCGTMVKDYGFLFRGDAALAQDAAAVAALARDVSEFLHGIGVGAPAAPRPLRVAYQSACSLQHGQQIHRQPVALLRGCGYEIVEPAEAHLCCGSAGTYNILQGEIAARLRDRKVAALGALSPQVIATGNVGCMTQLAEAAPCPVVHTVELIDWATGGPCPAPSLEAEP